MWPGVVQINLHLLGLLRVADAGLPVGILRVLERVDVAVALLHSLDFV